MDDGVAEVARDALASGDPLPGTCGFAGELDGRLVRDVLGRDLCYVEADAAELTSDAWSHDPDDLESPTLIPAGHVWQNGETRRAWSLPDPPANRERVVERVRDAILDAVTRSLDDTANLAVAFSGGVDSALLAAHADAPLYVAGYGDATDVESARESADAMRRRDDLRVCDLSLDDIEAAVPEVARAIGRTNAMDVQIALPLYLVATRVAADGHDHLALGQGADELFGGYAKVANAPDDDRVEADTVRGARREVLATLPDQLERDVRAIRTAGVEPVTPLLCDDVVRAALTLPGEWLVENGVRKRALREAANEWLPDCVANREKKAVQYGSLVAREVDRLARQAGFKRRMDDHVTKYVESRL
ncbi:asparagine synthase C-terminal domain-containing protein [Halobacterium zhouii]|uniref:asparagine synthase C-terminal domain-containing protein n=1 Tax=Halobacterium zhouii TaxID=2902624 RepID=UPI001E4F2ED1|nr:asparagine synthetase B [Halobacterium zhouii]